jgi:GWxTD domain-containing protein
MKYFVTVLLITAAFRGFSIDAYFNHSVFHTPEGGAYVETHMLFNASSLEFKNAAQGYQARVELTYIFESQGKVANFSKNIIKSPFITDSINAIVDFLDVQRFPLSPSTYKLTIKLRDINNPKDSGMIVQNINVEAPSDGAFFSDLIYLDTIYQNDGKTTPYSRGDYDMIPKISGYHGPENNTASIYTELYQSEITLGGANDYLVLLDIIDPKTDEVMSEFRVMKRMKGSAVQPIIHQWNIEGLRTGNFLVRIEARDRNNAVIASKSSLLQRHSFVPASDSLDDFQISSTFAGRIHSEDSLRNMVYCMRYAASIYEENYIEETWEQGDTTELRRFFYTFWRERNSVDPESSWKKYEQRIAYVENEFGLGNKRRHACATDRGRVYLKYGKPDTRVIQNREPNASPYEIWHFYKTPSKSNAKFVFYDPSLVTNDFVLLHSNVPGEQVDYSWYLQLSTPMVSPSGNDEPLSNTGEVIDFNNLNGTQMNTVGSRALDFWNNPR